MADIQRTVEIIFGAIDNTGQGLSSFSSNFDGAVDSVSNITKPLSDVADYALKAETAVVALGSAFLTFSVNEASKMQSSVSEIGTLFNGTAEQTDTFKRNIQDFAAGSTQSIASINGAVYSAISAGVDYQKSLELIAQTERLSIVGRAGLDDTTKLVVSTLNAYGESTNKAADYSDILFTAIQKGQIQLPELNSSLAQVTGTASAAGIPFDTLAAALAGLTVAGLPTSQAITGLKAAISNIISPSSEAGKAAAELGVQFDLNALKTDGLKGFLDKLNTATGGNIETMGRFFGSTEALNAIMVLASDKSGKFAESLDAMASRTGNVDNAFKLMADNLDLANQKMINAFVVTSQKIGDPLIDQWTDVVNAVSDVFNGVSISIDQGSFDPVFDAFNAFGADLAATLEQIAANLPEALSQVDFTGLIDSFRDLGFELGDLFGDIDLTTPEGLANAIQFVVDSFESLNRVVSGIVDFWGPVVQGFLAGVDAFNDLDDGSKKTTGNMLGLAQVFETLKDALISGSDAMDTIGKALTAIAGIQGAQSIAALGTAFAGAEIAALPLITALTAITIGVGGLAFGITENINAWDEYNSRQNTVADSTAHLAETQDGIKTKLSAISQSTGIAVTSMDELNKAVDDGRLVFNEATSAYEAAGSGVRDFDAEVAAAAQGGFDFADAVNQVAAGLVDTKEQTTNVIASFKTLAEAEQYFKDNLDGLGNATITYANGLFQINQGAKSTTDSTKDLTKATQDAAKANEAGTEEWKRVQDVMLETQKQTDDFTIAMGKLSNERYEIDVQANVDLKVAEIEADTSRIVAAFQSTADIVAVLTPAISDLWGTFSQTSSRWDQSEIKNAATRMESRLDAELLQKQQLNDAIVAKLQAQTYKLSSGDPLISIDAGSLAPELEMVFDKILKYTQIKATEQGLSLLVGL